MTVAAAEPDWDLTPYFTALDAADYRAFRDRLSADLTEVRERIAALAPPDVDRRDAWAEALAALEDVDARYGHLASYLHCTTSADSRDETGLREEAALARVEAELEKIWVLVRSRLAGSSAADFENLLKDHRLSGANYYLTRVREQAARRMAPELEALAADLSVDGLSAWGRLYDRLSGQLSFDLEVPGRPAERVPVSMTRTLLQDADGAVRAAARRGAAAAWATVAEPVAACLNAIAGTRLALYARRGIGDFLEPALFDAGIERATLEAMFAVVRERQEVPRRYLRRKAELLGLPRLGFHDLEAPLPNTNAGRLSWEQARERVQAAFAATYPALGDFARHAFDRHWIDHTPRAGKRPGGFCSSSHLIGESRIFMTFNGAGGDVQTLAHELGHAFHNWLMRSMRTWSRRYPMTLAETASTFAEEVVIDAALEAPDTPAAERAALLDERLGKASAFLLNIPTRFDFERALYERRGQGELSVRELQELMLEAQRANYGDALDPDQLDPWFWASKLHFYLTDISFYNFPYTFGFLFSMGIFARARAEGPSFLPRYEALLRATGTAPAEAVAAEHLGVDLRQPDFWRASVDLIEEDLARWTACTPVTGQPRLSRPARRRRPARRSGSGGCRPRRRSSPPP